MANYCKHCGSSLKDGRKCNCLPNDEPISTTQPYYFMPNESQKKKISKIKLLIFITIPIVLINLLVVYIFLQQIGFFAGTITFDPNAAVNVEDNNIQKYMTNQKFNLKPCEYENPGYLFSGWSTTKNGVVQYEDNAQLSLSKSQLTLYAIWTPSENYVIFDANGGEGEDWYIKLNTGDTQKLTKNTFTKPGCTFIGWSRTGENELDENYDLTEQKIEWKDEAEFTYDKTFEEGDTRLYAVWKNNDLKIHFVSDFKSYDDVKDGKSYSQNVKANEEVKLMKCKFKRKGFTFLGWSTLEGGYDVEYKEEDIFEMLVEDETLYAVWDTD